MGANFFNPFDHSLGSFRISGADDVGFDGFGCDGEGINLGGNVLHGFHPSEGFDPGAKVIDDFLGDGGCGDTADGFAG